MIRVGVAGWDYPDWDGIVYPARARRGFDRLAHLARYIDAIEVNVTFYRPLAPSVAASWVRRSADARALRFTAKLHRACTHGADEGESALALGATLESLAPLREAGRLEALLAQFPQGFHFDAAALERIERLCDGAAGWPLVVEVRHTSWKVPEVEAWLRERGVGWCAVDQPLVGDSTLGVLPRVTGDVAYLRLHGRNRQDWFRADAGRDARYDYLYRRDELHELAAAARRMAEQAPSVVVIQNNHFRGQALANALQMKHLLEGTRPAAPEDLLLTYPELESDVEVERTRLF